MVNLPRKLEEKLQKRKDNGAFRELTDVHKLTDFSSNDYLGLAKSWDSFHKSLNVDHPIESQMGSTGSRLLSGNNNLYTSSEEYLAKVFKVEAALIYNSGYDANIGLFSSIPQREDIVLYDAYVHASIRDGLSLGKAKNYPFRHNDLDHLESLILRQIEKRYDGGELYVVTESVFSMDGDNPNLKDLVVLCNKYSCRLVVDEAHAFGLYGSSGLGKITEFGLIDNIFAVVITFGKALGNHGAAVLGTGNLKSYLVNFSRSFIYTTALPAHTILNIVSAIDFLQTNAGQERRKTLFNNITYFQKQICNFKLEESFLSSASAIQSCVISGNLKVRKVSNHLKTKGFDVRPILYPTVPKGLERLRFCLHSFNTQKEIETVLLELSKVI
ncbi:aminotransferase class I/II-fold pyridoxal phosphate-dependent enzyme [Eudoraea chungangensis]|uniref:aminotransferase class I/II-fold pyridoxal phosphate-dependent enzyme n=1 Tax=Eudoraea chungangensis TaxID=1481905 RepID=UPI0023EB2006|nr:pyridoxal phosphate-dependent aminotransferase family protein [Eudoraea chungangensis]